jgi:small GTP-binding protein
VLDHEEVRKVVDGHLVDIQLWDTAGNEDYADRLRPLCYPQTDVFLVCAGSSESSEENLLNIRQRWIPELRHHMPGVPILLVETKADLVEDEDYPVALTALAKEEGLGGVMSTSAHEYFGVQECFEHAIRLGLWWQRTQMQKKCDSKKGLISRTIALLRRKHSARGAAQPLFATNLPQISATYACGICLDDGFAVKDTAQCFQGCRHRICRSCAKAYIEGQGKEGVLHINCPDVTNGRCKALSTRNIIRRVCGAQTLAAYDKNLSANHGQYVGQLQADGAAGRNLEFITWLHDNSRNCPSCSVLIFRYAGCDSMLCKCGQSFNWKKAPKVDLPEVVKKKRDSEALAAAIVEARKAIAAVMKVDPSTGSGKAYEKIAQSAKKWPESPELLTLLTEAEKMKAEAERADADRERQAADDARHRFEEAATVLERMIRSRMSTIYHTMLPIRSSQCHQLQPPTAKLVAAMPEEPPISVEAVVAEAEKAAKQVAEAEAVYIEASAMVVKAEMDLQLIQMIHCN